MFDQAADDDVSDDGEVDLPFAEEVPGPESDEESGAAGEDEPATQAGPAPEEAASEQVAAEEAAPEEIDFAGIVAETDAQDLLTAQGGEEVEVTPEAAKPSSGVPAQSRRRKKAEPAVAGGALEARTEEGVEGVDLKPLDDQEMRAALEAIMLVVDEPVAEMQLAQVLEQPTERVAAMLEDISARYTAAGHGFDLRRVAGGWRLYTRPEYAPYVERFVLDGQSVRLTQAALETLAVVAYKQPVTRSRISAIRGVNCDGVMRTLVTRGLIEECGTESETGAHLYRTTGLFLEKLGLNSVGQLPPLAPFLPDDVEEVLDASG
nr:SMC-Scp complex subunit ScpB [Actinoplanes sp. RD1]